MASDPITFMVTDIVGSTERWGADAAIMTLAQQEHDDIVSTAIHDNHGEIVRHTGDGFIATFADSLDAADGALACQDRIARAKWPGDQPLEVRVALHTGEAEERGGIYFGLPVNCTVRLNSLAHGGQILLTGETRLALGDRLRPMHRLRALGRVRLRGIVDSVEVFQLASPSLDADFPPLLGRLGSPPLPDSLTAFVGRSRELAEVIDMLRRHRVVSILGPGGMGKTRLAYAVAQHLQHEPDVALWWCELASIDDPERVPDALAAVVGFSDRLGRDVFDALVHLFAETNAVVVLDNAEHVVAGVANLVRHLVHACPGLRVLCTSREALAITGERTIALGPLDVERAATGEHGPAVELFADRAASVDREFVVDERNLAEVMDLCRRLDGLPLALEIAAARIRSLGVGEILANIDERFRLLRWDRRDKDARHQSLEAAIEWTYEVTPPEERAFFERLSVFGADFDLAAASAVTGDLGDTLAVIEGLDRLIARSLVVRVDAEPPRYRLLESLREFGRSQLAPASFEYSLREGWATHYVSLAEEAARGLCGPDDEAWVRRLGLEFTNLRLVQRWCVDHGEVDLALRLCAALFDYAFFTLTLEVGEWTAAALAMTGASVHPLFGAVTGAAAGLAWASGSHERARALVQEAVAADPTSWVAQQSLGTVALFGGDLPGSLVAWERATAAASAKGDAFHELISSGQVLFGRHLGGDVDVPVHAAALRHRAEESGNAQARAFASWVLGVSLAGRDPVGALEEFNRSLEISQRIGSELLIGSVLDPAAQVRQRLARSSMEENVGDVLQRARYWARVGNTPNQWRAVMDFVFALGHLGLAREAAVLFGAWDSAPLKIAAYGVEADRLENLVARLRAELGEDAFADALAEGHRLGQDQLLATLESDAETAGRVANA